MRPQLSVGPRAELADEDAEVHGGPPALPNLLWGALLSLRPRQRTETLNCTVLGVTFVSGGHTQVTPQIKPFSNNTLTRTFQYTNKLEPSMCILTDVRLRSNAADGRHAIGTSGNASGVRRRIRARGSVRARLQGSPEICRCQPRTRVNKEAHVDLYQNPFGLSC